MSCICCGTDCVDEGEYYCSFCDALYDVIEDADMASDHAEECGGIVSEELEAKMALAYRAYDELEARRDTCRDLHIGEGCTWRKAAA